MEIVEHNLLTSYQELKQQNSNGAATQSSAEQLNAWKISQEMVEGVKTWPYSIDTLRNLLITVLIPGAAAVARLLAEVFID